MDVQTEPMMRLHSVLLGCLLLTACGSEPDFDPPGGVAAEPRQTSPWPSYGGAGGRKFASLGDALNRTNVADLELAWTYRTGVVDTVFQATPVLADGRLLFCTPYNKVVALDPLTGGELWTFDPEIDPDLRPANEFNCRAVAPMPREGDACPSRVFMATNDARLIALSGVDGTPCEAFGRAGEVDLSEGVGDTQWAGEYQVTSPPVIAGERVIVGSAISDGNRTDAPSGVVRAFDAITGQLAWAFDLAPPDFDYATGAVSAAGYALGTPNVWAPMSVDDERDLVFLPTGNPAPDYYREGPVDMAHYAASVIALKASTGELVWHFNTVLKDFWDFDVPSQPVLSDLEIDGALVPVLIQATKMGHVFVLNRETGAPVVDVDYRQVPRHGPLENQLSDVQPFPPEAFQTSRSYTPGESLLGLCDDLDAESVSGPVFTPITEQWTIGLPSNMGATNWGGVAVDPTRGLIVVNTNSVPFRTKLIARSEAQDLLDVLQGRSATAEERRDARAQLDLRFNLPPGTEVAPQNGVDYLMARHPYLDPTLGIPCAGAPLAEIMAIDVNRRQQVWRHPHGTLRDVISVPLEWGAPGMGGAAITESGLILIGAAAERRVRAYDIESGEELWQHALPAPGNATPMTYTVRTEAGERPFVVIAAGGDSRGGIGGQGDYMVAFSLPGEG